MFDALLIPHAVLADAPRKPEACPTWHGRPAPLAALW